MNETPPAPSTRSGGVIPFVVIAVVVGSIAVVLQRVGFIGISDDDAARTLIAWDFARAPALDATRSSWLPVHTYVLGAMLAVSREIWWTPRVLSLLAAFASGTGALALGRGMGANARWATAAAIASLAFPWSVFCAWAPGVPEMPCAALVIWGVAVLVAEHARDAVPDTRRVMIAAVLLGLACGHRYEAWFATAGATVAAAWVWRAHRRVVAVLIAVVAVVPLAWLAINHARDGHAFEFATRVAQYRSEEAAGQGDAFARGPWRQFGALSSLASILLVAAVWASRRLGARAAIPIAAGVSVLALLVATEALGGGATHHPARSLLLVVWLLAPVAFAGFSRAWSVGDERMRAVLVLGALATALQLASGTRIVPRDIAPDTIAAGRAAIALTGPGERFFVDAGHLDFLWLELASGAPERAIADREFGAPRVDPVDAMARAGRCRTAAVRDVATEQALIAAGWHRHARTYGAWTLLTAP